MKVILLVLAGLLATQVALAEDGKGDLLQGTVGAGPGGGFTTPDGTAGVGFMARGSFKYLKDSTHLILSIDSAAAIGIRAGDRSWSDGVSPIGFADLRAAVGAKTNGATGCGFFGLGGGEGGYNGLGVSQARVNAFVESGLACNRLLGSQLDLLVGPLVKVQGDFLQQNSAKVLAGGRAELVGPRGNLTFETVQSVANLSSGPMDAVAQFGASASGEIKVWRGLALGAAVAYDSYGYKTGPFTYRMDGLSGMGYLAWHFDRKPAASTAPAK